LSSCTVSLPESTEPGFSGPWGEQLRNIYEHTDDQRLKQILSDGVIDSSEVEEIKQEQIACLKSLGATSVDLEADGSGSITLPAGPQDSMEDVQQRTRELQTQCNQQTNWSTVSSLFSEMKRNPSNEDTAVLMARCLVRVGLAPEGYTPTEYMDDFNSDTFLDYLEHQETPDALKFQACNEDPIHAQP
jgi:hypothetical protein